MLKALRVALATLIATSGALVFAPTASAEVDVYSVPGYHTVNGREWYTECEPYSITHRCRTEIMATVVTEVNGRFVQTTDWAFNNLTYLPSPRTAWTTNPLGAYGKAGGTAAWTGTDGRKWRTECDTDATGRGGCRSYIEASVIVKTGTGYQWAKREIFNSMVRFGAVQAPPAPVEEEVVPIDIADVPAAVNGWEAVAAEGTIVYLSPDSESDAAIVLTAIGDSATVAEVASDLTAQQKVGSATCGTFPDGGEACVFTTAKYGTTIAFAFDAPRADLHAVTTAVMARLA